MAFRLVATVGSGFSRLGSAMNWLRTGPALTKLMPCNRKSKMGFVTMQCGTGGCCGYSKEDLKERLTPTQYQVTQEKDTERPFSGKYLRNEEKGIYKCIVCQQDIFSSEMKYPSQCGWPAFFDVVSPDKVKLTPDLSLEMNRTEVSCSKCGAHMGHVFDDGPKPTGKRYCINSASLDFQKAGGATEANTTSATTNNAPSDA